VTDRCTGKNRNIFSANELINNDLEEADCKKENEIEIPLSSAVQMKGFVI